ncbi:MULTISPECIES: DUF4105 domain-containing protein [unclassified Carboxylicivirga]|uniref:lipoprotein N-acyltransferase Lnb domain-containing protein n=1 Tax=Carboxylicivirga TaxID=1628153 RepID=UPI003D32D070
MRYILLIVLTFLLSLSLKAQARLSDQAHISLITCSPGEELYALFGHSAIRVNDPVAGFDWVFNYGTFDFDTPNFYLKFANGNLNYMLSRGDYARFVTIYNYEKRSVYEQPLILSSQEKQDLFEALMINLQGENRFYRYDFLFDNCATRIRDIITANLDVAPVYDDAAFDEYTFREMLHQYDGDKPWIADGLDLILGMKTDYPANQHDQMFLPDYLMKHLGGAVRADSGLPLLGETHTVLSFDKPLEGVFFTPALFFWLLFIGSIILAYYELRCQRPLVWLNRFFLLLSGLVGCLIFFLWFLSRHSVTGENFNMLWAMPFNVFVAFLANWFYRSKIFGVYLIFLLVCASLPILFFWAIPQYLPAMVYPLCLLLLSRYATWFYLNNKA